MWEKLPYPVISTIEMNNDKSGFINIEFYETNDKCIGTIALNNNNEGSWSISCPDNPKRKGVFKRNYQPQELLLLCQINLLV